MGSVCDACPYCTGDIIHPFRFLGSSPRVEISTVPLYTNLGFRDNHDDPMSAMGGRINS